MEPVHLSSNHCIQIYYQKYKESSAVNFLLCMFLYNLQATVGTLVAIKFGTSGEAHLSKFYAVAVVLFICLYVAGFAWSWVLLVGWSPVKYFLWRFDQLAKVSMSLSTCFSTLSSLRSSLPCSVKWSLDSFTSSVVGWSSWQSSLLCSSLKPRMCQLKKWSLCGRAIGSGVASLETMKFMSATLRWAMASPLPLELSDKQTNCCWLSSDHGAQLVTMFFFLSLF